MMDYQGNTDQHRQNAHINPNALRDKIGEKKEQVVDNNMQQYSSAITHRHERTQDDGAGLSHGDGSDRFDLR